ncbi:MAG: hypothetical protein AAB152_04185 [Candidatus Coatesbacteria bacterium]
MGTMVKGGAFLSRLRIPRGVELAVFAWWAFAVLQAYYAAVPVDWKNFGGAITPHLPATSFAWPHVAERLARLGAGHGAVLAWVLGLAGPGLVFARWLRLATAPGGERVVLGFALGAAAAMLLWLGLGLAGLMHPGLGWGLAAAGAAVAWNRRRDAAGWRGAGGPGRWLGIALSAVVALNAAAIPAAWALAKYAERPAFGAALAGGWIALCGLGWIAWAVRVLAFGAPGVPAGLGLWERALLAVFAAEAAVTFLVVAAVVEAPDRFYDAQVYHLATPALFAMYHKVVGLPNLLHTSFPLGVQMLYGWLGLLGGEPAARAWRVWLVAGIAWTVFRLGSRAGRSFAGLAGAAVFVACPVLVLNAVQTSVDVELTLLLLLAALAAREAGGRLPGIAVAAVLGGAAFAAKYTAVFFLPWLALLAAAPPGRWFPRPARALPAVAVFAAVSLCWAVPWFLRNEAVVGNPVYPYATRLFPGGRQWDPARLARFREQAAAYAITKPSELPRLPWRLTKGDTSENYIGAAFLLLLPVAIAHPPAAGVRVFAGLAGLAVASWLGVTHIHRFVLPAWGLLALFIAVALWELLGVQRWYARVCLVLLAVTGATNLVADVVLCRMVFDPVEILAGRESPADYLDRKMINSYAAAAFGARPLLERGSRVMMVGESRGLYWGVPFYNHSAYDVQVFEEALRDARDADRMAVRLRELGVAYLFVNDREVARLKFRFRYPMLEFTARQRALLGELWSRRIVTVLDGGVLWQLFRVLPAARAATGTIPPLVFDETALRNEFEGFSTISWQGDAVIKMTKKMIGP